jgi:6-phosphogluconolactonase
VSVNFEVVADPARACAAMMVSAALGGGEIVLAGGSTPKAANENFVEAVKTVGLDLRRTVFWLGDERCVEPDDERSNYRMIAQSLIEPLAGMTDVEVRRIKGELGPDAAADDYEHQLRSAGPPRFDLVLLGIGPDGHTASMFPDQPSVSERSRLVVGVAQAGLEPFVPRVTLTIPVLTASRQVVILASGESKAAAIAAAFGPDALPDPHVPSSMLVPEPVRLTVLVDAAAASGLHPEALAR